MPNKDKSRLIADSIPGIAGDRLDDAKALLAAGRWGGASYMCGYAVELGLKWKICAKLKWKEYPDSGLEHRLQNAMETHNLAELLVISGKSSDLKDDDLVFPQWTKISTWAAEQRYKAKEVTVPEKAKADVEASSIVLNYFLENE